METLNRFYTNSIITVLSMFLLSACGRAVFCSAPRLAVEPIFLNPPRPPADSHKTQVSIIRR